jgi:hypothetical protein
MAYGAHNFPLSPDVQLPLEEKTDVTSRNVWYSKHTPIENKGNVTITLSI